MGASECPLDYLKQKCITTTICSVSLVLADDTSLSQYGRSSGRVGSIRNYCLQLAGSTAYDWIAIVDDDIDLRLEHVDSVLASAAHLPRATYGANITGRDSRDTLSQLLSAAGHNPAESILSDSSLLFGHNTISNVRPYISGGFILINSRVLGDLKPFPETYNETWIWCLLNRIENGIPSILLDINVSHLRRSSLSSAVQSTVQEQLGVLIARILKRIPKKFSLSSSSWIDWLCSESMPSRLGTLSPARRLLAPVECGSSTFCDRLDKLLESRIGIGAHALADELAGVDWHSLVMKWAADYQELGRTFAKGTN